MNEYIFEDITTVTRTLRVWRDTEKEAMIAASVGGLKYRLEKEGIELIDTVETGSVRLKSEARYPIGTKFKTRGKTPRLCTVVDILRTYDNAGEMTSLRYVATHQFCGQVMADTNVVETTITMGLVTE